VTNFFGGSDQAPHHKNQYDSLFFKKSKNARNADEIRLTSIIENCPFPIHHRRNAKH
jgi:hypothetical protein